MRMKEVVLQHQLGLRAWADSGPSPCTKSTNMANCSLHGVDYGEAADRAVSLRLDVALD